jgi:endonuclease-3 related protein
MAGPGKTAQKDCRSDLLRIYDLLNGHFGNLHWWPAEEPFEVMIGAILTQNTAWTNVEKAIAALKERRLLSPAAIDRVDQETLAGVIRPAGYFRVKAKRLKALVRFFLAEYGGSIEAMAAEELPSLREKLLAVRGVGPETADGILLYACGKPVFIGDAYTRRILQRHHRVPEEADVQQVRHLFMTHLPHDASLFNQFHALFVHTGKTFCRTEPKCGLCPLRKLDSETVNP